MKKKKTIFTVFEKIINKTQKEKLLNQRAKVIWLTGLSGSGKTTLGINIERALFNKGFLTQILDGDNIRAGINKNLQFTEADRQENILIISEVNKLFLNCWLITINCFISPTNEIRKKAREIIGGENIIDVYVSTPIKICEERDTKGLYQRARNGEIKNFTGIDSPFEVPDKIDIEIRTDLLTIEESTNKLLEYILKHIEY